MPKIFNTLFLAAWCAPFSLLAQPGRTTLLAEHIHTLRTTVDGEDTFVPVIQLGVVRLWNFPSTTSPTNTVVTPTAWSTATIREILRKTSSLLTT